MSVRSSESTGPSPSEGTLSVNSDTDVLEKLCVRIHKKLVAPVSKPLATLDHRSAVGMMLKVRDILMQGRVEVSQKSKTCIVCSGVACMKRTYGGVERDEATGLIKTTVTLLFILLLLCEKSTDLQEDMYEEPKNDMQPEAKKPRTRIHRDDEQLIAAWMCASLADIVLRRDDAQASSWGQLLRSDVSVSRVIIVDSNSHTTL